MEYGHDRYEYKISYSFVYCFSENEITELLRDIKQAFVVINVVAGLAVLCHIQGTHGSKNCLG